MGGGRREEGMKGMEIGGGKGIEVEVRLYL